MELMAGSSLGWMWPVIEAEDGGDVAVDMPLEPRPGLELELEMELLLPQPHPKISCSTPSMAHPLPRNDCAPRGEAPSDGEGHVPDGHPWDSSPSNNKHKQKTRHHPPGQSPARPPCPEHGEPMVLLLRLRRWLRPRQLGRRLG